MLRSGTAQATNQPAIGIAPPLFPGAHLYLLCESEIYRNYFISMTRSNCNKTWASPLQWLQAKDGTLAWYPGSNYRKVRKVSIWRTIRFPGFLCVNSDRTNQAIRIYTQKSLRWLPSLDRTFLGLGHDLGQM